MAKRGYRGSHPYNDMKVDQNGPFGNGKASNNDKLTNEYNKTSAKYKYDFIKSHDGFYPQGSATITIAGGGTSAVDADNTITMSSADGSQLIINSAGSTNASADPPQYKHNGSATVAADGIVLCVNTNMGGKISASNAAGVITLTQNAPGPDGNSAIQTGSDAAVHIWAGCTVPGSFSGG